MVGKLYAFFDLRDELLYAVAWVPVSLHVVSVGISVNTVNNDVGHKEAVEDLVKALIWILVAGFFKFVHIFF